MLNKVFKILLIVSTAGALELIWLKWLSGEPLALWNILYITAIGILYVIMTMFLIDNGSEWRHTITVILKGGKAEQRHAMKLDKERFLNFAKARYLIKTTIGAVEAISFIKAYCEKNGIPEDDGDIKFILDFTLGSQNSPDTTNHKPL